MQVKVNSVHQLPLLVDILALRETCSRLSFLLLFLRISVKTF